MELRTVRTLYPSRFDKVYVGTNGQSNRGGIAAYGHHIPQRIGGKAITKRCIEGLAGSGEHHVPATGCWGGEKQFNLGGKNKTEGKNNK